MLLIVLMSFINVEILSAQGCIGTPGEVTWSYWRNMPSYYDTTYLFGLENFPSYPDGTQTLGSLDAPNFFEDRYASMMRGYIMIPSTDSVNFNITSDDDGYFFLSTDQSPDNKELLAYHTDWTYDTEYFKYATQTSEKVELIGGTYYYFEVIHIEGGWQDHVQINWNFDFPTDSTAWSVIDFTYIYDYACGLDCQPRGTPCDDGDATTTQDLWDGYCNCVGIADNGGNSCVGERMMVQAYYYDSIPGSYVEDNLLDDPDFPLLPDRTEYLEGAYGPLDPNELNEYGTLVQGFLTVPVTGYYEFNITGDNQTFFFLSSDDLEEHKQSHQALVMYGVGFNEHDESVIQTISELHLEKGQYYYFEFRHKEGSWNDYFNLFWKTPFYEDDRWKRIPSFYLFDYECEVACIPQGTPCNDGDPFTTNDQMDANCNCVGTPCAGQDCDDPIGQFIASESCAATDNLDTRSETSWLSCQSMANPNPARGSSRWIMYDFGEIHTFEETHVWNYNVPGETDRGFRNVVLDYSDDGINWTQFGGTYEWTQAPGDFDYQGINGPNFNETQARYILITSLTNWGDGSCHGLSKITFNASLCGPQGSACDDGNPLTINDMMDDNCQCTGTDVSNFHCSEDTLSLGAIAIDEMDYEAKMEVNSESTVSSSYNITFSAGDQIVLLPGFEVENTAQFSANIAECVEQSIREEILRTTSLKRRLRESHENDLFISDPGKSRFPIKEIYYKLDKAADVRIEIQTIDGERVTTIVDRHHQYIGAYKKHVPTKKLTDPLYLIVMTIDGEKIVEKMLIEPT